MSLLLIVSPHRQKINHLAKVSHVTYCGAKPHGLSQFDILINLSGHEKGVYLSALPQFTANDDDTSKNVFMSHNFLRVEISLGKEGRQKRLNETNRDAKLLIPLNFLFFTITMIFLLRKYLR